MNQLIFHSSNNKYHGIECSDGNLPGYWYRKFSVTPQFQIFEKIFVKDAKKDTAATIKEVTAQDEETEASSQCVLGENEGQKVIYNCQCPD